MVAPSVFSPSQQILELVEGALIPYMCHVISNSFEITVPQTTVLKKLLWFLEHCCHTPLHVIWKVTQKCLYVTISDNIFIVEVKTDLPVWCWEKGSISETIFDFKNSMFLCHGAPNVINIALEKRSIHLHKRCPSIFHSQVCHPIKYFLKQCEILRCLFLFEKGASLY